MKSLEFAEHGFHSLLPGCLVCWGKAAPPREKLFISSSIWLCTWRGFHQCRVVATSPKPSLGVQLSFSGCSSGTGPRTPHTRASMSRSCHLLIRIGIIILQKCKVLALSAWAHDLQTAVPSRQQSTGSSPLSLLKTTNVERPVTCNLSLKA